MGVVGPLRSLLQYDPQGVTVDVAGCFRRTVQVGGMEGRGLQSRYMIVTVHVFQIVVTWIQTSL